MVMVVPIIIGALGIISKILKRGLEELEIGRRTETIQTTAWLRSARILRRVPENCCQRASPNADGKNPLRVCDDRRNDQSHNKRMQQISTKGV